jgi:hypothetical protein
LATARWQSVSRPVLVTEQVVFGFPLAVLVVLAPAFGLPTGALGAGDALALGLGVPPAVLPGAVLAWASPVSIRALAAVITASAGQRPMPRSRFRLKLGLLRGVWRLRRGEVGGSGKRRSCAIRGANDVETCTPIC